MEEEASFRNQLRKSTRSITMSLRVLFLLYRKIGPVTLLITILFWVYAEWPIPADRSPFAIFLVYFIWMRTICQVLVWYSYKRFNRTGFYFYHHFGFSELQLMSILYLFDLLILSFFIYLKTNWGNS